VHTRWIARRGRHDAADGKNETGTRAHDRWANGIDVEIWRHHVADGEAGKTSNDYPKRRVTGLEHSDDPCSGEEACNCGVRQ
jgi:hypothetical protein